jgi:hypothetical protein
VRKSGLLTKRERYALEHFSEGPAELPRGIGATNLYNLIQHKWLIRVAREYDFGPERYVTTADGKAALEADDKLRALGR